MRHLWIIGMWIALVPMLLAGCGMTRASQRPPEPITILQPQSPERLIPKKGSIWQTADRNTLFLDNKARNVGDIVTVMVSETSQATKSAETTLSRENENELDLGTMFGWSTALIAKGNQYLDVDPKLSSKGEHSGKGSTSRNGTFTSTISCIVTEVLINGNLRIEGRRDITINHENQFIVLSGIIRPEDISPANSVLSAQIADARIEYSGDGDIDDQQRPSWLQMLLAAIRII